MLSYRQALNLVGILGALLAFAACSLPVQPTPFPLEQSTPTLAPQITPEAGDLLIEGVRILPDALPPARYAVEIKGYFINGCISLAEVKQGVQEKRIVVTLITTHPKEVQCIQALVPFTHTEPLNTIGLAAGEYIVDVHGITTTLTLTEKDTAPPAKAPTPVEKSEITQGRAMVEEIDIMIAESYPVQVFVVLRGNLPDGCTKLTKITQEIEDHMIRLTLYTERPRDAICTMALVPFTEQVPLDTRGLAPGTYTVLVNGLRAEFTLE